MNLHVLSRLSDFDLTLAHSNGKGQGLNISAVNFCKMITDKATITIIIKCEIAYGISNRPFELGLS